MGCPLYFSKRNTVFEKSIPGPHPPLERPEFINIRAEKLFVCSLYPLDVYINWKTGG
jgi:hypothetical protein